MDLQKKEALHQLNKSKKELTAKIQELDSNLSQAKLDCLNYKAAEEKLRSQIVENSKNANISQSQLEANLTEKIKTLDT